MTYLRGTPGDRIVDLRKNKGWSQEELAKQVTLSPSQALMMIQMITTAKPMPNISNGLSLNARQISTETLLKTCFSKRKNTASSMKQRLS